MAKAAGRDGHAALATSPMHQRFGLVSGEGVCMSMTKTCNEKLEFGSAKERASVATC